MKNRIFTFIFLLQCLFYSFFANTQCNTNTTICTPGVAGPFTFHTPSGNPSSCLDFINGSTANYAYIILYITQSGNLDLLVQGNNAGTGCLDVSIFDITNQQNPCASMSSATEIGCNYVVPCQGCAEFGSTINSCAAQVSTPYVNAGDVVMILVEDWSNAQSSFTLELGNAPNSAQTGPPDATINPVGPFCTTDGATQLTAVNNGGTWSGPGVSATGMFNPAVAGTGTHTINYSIGSSPCNSASSTQITVGSIAISSMNVGACQSGNIHNVSGTVQISNPPPTGQLIIENCEGEQIVVANAPFSVGSYPFNLTGLSANIGACDIHAYFTSSSCSHILNYTAPTCAGCSISDLETNVGACQSNGTYSVGGNITFTNPPSTGSLVVTTTCGGTHTFNPPFTSPATYSIAGLPANGANCNVRAYFSADETCQLIESFTAPTVVTPTFNPISACLNSTPPALPTTSLNGISGTWSPSTISTATAGLTNYTFTPTAGQCASTGTLPVTINALPDVQVPPGGVLYECLVSPTVQLNSSSTTPGVSFAWTGNSFVSGQTTPNPVVNATGTYAVTVTNPTTGCTNSASVAVVGDGNEPDVSIATPGIISCSNPTVTLSASSPTTGATFAWTANPGIVSGGSTLTPVVNQASTYQITVTAPNSCTNAASVVVTGNTDLPDVNNTPSSYVISCDNPTVAINGSSTVSGVTYSWTGVGIVSGQNTDNIIADEAGTYVVTVTNPSNSCVNTATFTVTGNMNPPNISIANPSSLDCNNPTVQLQGTSSTPGAISTWTGPGIVSGGNTLTPIVNAPGTYVVIVTDPVNNCTSTDSVVVTEIGHIIPSSFPNTTICGNIFQIPLSEIVANGNVTWTEQNGNGTFSNTGILNPIFTGDAGITDYLLTFTDECGFTRTSRLILQPPHHVTAPSVSCDLAEFNIVTQSHNGGVWTVIENPNTPYIEDTTLTFIYGDTITGGTQSTAVSVSNHGTYTLYFDSDDVCPDTSITLNFLPYLWTEISDTTLCMGVQYQLSAWESPYTADYTWNTGANGTSIVVTQQGEYIVTLSNVCHTYSDTAFITYETCDIEAPNVISLSSQAGNNIWYVNSLGVADFHCIIVNRWGNVIYEYDNVNGYWDGKDRGGNLVPEGVYFYSIDATYEGGEQAKKHGFIHVVH